MTNNSLDRNWLQIKLNYFTINALHNFIKIEYNPYDFLELELLIKRSKVCFNKKTPASIKSQIWTSFLLNQTLKYLKESSSESLESQRAFVTCFNHVFNRLALKCVSEDMVNLFKGCFTKKARHLILKAQNSTLYQSELSELLKQYDIEPQDDNSNIEFTNDAFHQQMVNYLVVDLEFERKHPSLAYKMANLCFQEIGPHKSHDDIERELIEFAQLGLAEKISPQQSPSPSNTCSNISLDNLQ
jgi:hypothetical protein